MGQVTHILMALILFCEGADMNEGQLMGDLELDSKQLEAESWSQVVDSKFLQQQYKDVVKRQDVIYGETSSLFTHCKQLLDRNTALVSSKAKLSFLKFLET